MYFRVFGNQFRIQSVGYLWLMVVLIRVDKSIDIHDTETCRPQTCRQNVVDVKVHGRFFVLKKKHRNPGNRFLQEAFCFKAAAGLFLTRKLYPGVLPKFWALRSNQN